MNDIAFGDIHLVQFEPSVGHEYKKIRPALVIQQDEFLRSSLIITVIPLSVRLEKRGRHDIFIERDAKNRLTHDSVVRVQHIMSFDRQERFKGFIGRAGSPVIRQVRGYLRRHFGL